MWVVWNLNIHAKQLGLLPKCNQKKVSNLSCRNKEFPNFYLLYKAELSIKYHEIRKNVWLHISATQEFFSMSIKRNFAKWFKVRQIWSTIKINLSLWHTVACIIVRRLLISVHKWQFSGMAATHEYWSQHDAHLVYLPIFHGLNLIIFS